MNKTYIKRQITLYKLDFYIDKDIQEYIEHFKDLIGEPNEYIKERGMFFDHYKGYLYSKNDTGLFFYDDGNELIVLDDSHIWEEYLIRTKLDEQNAKVVLSALFEVYFKHNIDELNYSGAISSSNVNNNFTYL